MIDKCNGENCPIRKDCYRFYIKSKPHQGYILNPGVIKNNVFRCDFYLSESTYKALLAAFNN